MSRSHHVTASALRKERLELAREGLWPLNHMTELEARDIQSAFPSLTLPVVAWRLRKVQTAISTFRSMADHCLGRLDRSPRSRERHESPEPDHWSERRGRRTLGFQFDAPFRPLVRPVPPFGDRKPRARAASFGAVMARRWQSSPLPLD